MVRTFRGLRSGMSYDVPDGYANALIRAGHARNVTIASGPDLAPQRKSWKEMKAAKRV